MRDISRKRYYYHLVIDTWIYIIHTYYVGIDYHLPPPGYILLDIDTIP